MSDVCHGHGTVNQLHTRHTTYLLPADQIVPKSPASILGLEF